MTFSNVSVFNFDNAIRGMRNPLMSHDKSDTVNGDGGDWHFNNNNNNNYAPVDASHGSWIPHIGPNDYDLAKRLILAGEPHRKFLRQIFVSVDIKKMPAYMLHEFATYKIGTTLDCSSTVHKITSRPLTADDFEEQETDLEIAVLGDNIEALNICRENYLIAKNDGDTVDAEKCFRAMKRMLPSGYLYEVMTWTANYETLSNIWYWRHSHRLPIWHEFCENFIEKLPYAEFITKKF